MTREDLDALVAFEQKASPAPWHVLFANDDLCMNATLVTKNPSTGRVTSSHHGDWQADDVIAGCLIQSPQVATSDDNCWDENARLIATMRNALPELLRLARAGLNAA